MHIEFWAVFFKMGRLLNLWVSGIFFFKGNELVLFIAPRHLVGRVRKQKPVDAPLQGRSKSSALTSWIATHQKLRKKYPFPQDVGPVTFYPQSKKWQDQRTEGASISFVTFDVLRFKRSNLAKMKALAMAHPLVFVFRPCRPSGAEL